MRLVKLQTVGTTGIPQDNPCTLITECQPAVDQGTLPLPSQIVGLRLVTVLPVAANQEQKVPKDEQSTSLDSLFSH